MGVCRFLLWLILIVFIEVITMELPMFYLRGHLDDSWCTYEAAGGNSALIDVI